MNFGNYPAGLALSIRHSPLATNLTCWRKILHTFSPKLTKLFSPSITSHRRVLRGIWFSLSPLGSATNRQYANASSSVDIWRNPLNFSQVVDKICIYIHAECYVDIFNIYKVIECWQFALIYTLDKVKQRTNMDLYYSRQLLHWSIYTCRLVAQSNQM